MLKWVEVLWRILKLYNVRSARELGMALGIPVRLEEHGAVEEIPWEILELVVADKGVSWDWLLTGRDFCPIDPATKGDKNAPGTPIIGNLGAKPIVRDSAPSRPLAEERVDPPRFETRELARTLLPGASDHRGNRHDTAPGEPAPEQFKPPSVPVGSDIGRTWTPPQTADEVNEKRKEEVIRELEDLKASMERELTRVENILREKKG